MMMNPGESFPVFRDLPKGTQLAPTPRCPICGQRISANKRFCLKHAVEEAKKAGLIAA